MLKKLRGHLGIIILLSTLPFANHYKPSVQNYLYGQPQNNSQPPSTAEITHIYEDVYRARFDHQGDGALDGKLTRRLYKGSLEDNID